MIDLFTNLATLNTLQQMSGHFSNKDSIVLNVAPNDTWSDNSRFIDLRARREEYIAALSKKSDKQLEKMLDTIQAQIGMAYKQRNDDGLALLQEKEDQVTEARARKLG